MNKLYTNIRIVADNHKTHVCCRQRGKLQIKKSTPGTAYRCIKEIHLCLDLYVCVWNLIWLDVLSPGNSRCIRHSLIHLCTSTYQIIQPYLKAVPLSTIQRSVRNDTNEISPQLNQSTNLILWSCPKTTSNQIFQPFVELIKWQFIIHWYKSTPLSTIQRPVRNTTNQISPQLNQSICQSQTLVLQNTHTHTQETRYTWCWSWWWRKRTHTLSLL